MDKVHPLPGYVFVKRNTAEMKTSAGILLPEKAAEKPKTATVIEVGEDVKSVKKGDIVIYKDDYNAGNVEFPINKEEHTIVHADNIVATVG